MLGSAPSRSTIALCASRTLIIPTGICQVSVWDGVSGAASLLTFGWLMHNGSSIGSRAQAAPWSKWTTSEKCLYSQGHFGLCSKELPSFAEYSSCLILCFWNKGNFQWPVWLITKAYSLFTTSLYWVSFYSSTLHFQSHQPLLGCLPFIVD